MRRYLGRFGASDDVPFFLAWTTFLATHRLRCRRWSSCGIRRTSNWDVSRRRVV